MYKLQDIPLGPGHGFTPTYHFLHSPIPVCLDLQRARGVTQGEGKAPTAGTRKLEMAPWTSLSVLPQLFSSLLAGYGGAHLATLPGAPARPALGPPTARVHMSPRSHHHPAEDVNVSPLRKTKKLAYFGDQQRGNTCQLFSPERQRVLGLCLRAQN